MEFKFSIPKYAYVNPLLILVFSKTEIFGAFFKFCLFIAEIPITCPTLELNEAISSFNFAATLSCSNDQLDGANSEIRPHVPIGGQCTYSYNCDFDAPNTTRQVTKTCQSNGKWSEEQPECTDSDELVSLKRHCYVYSKSHLLKKLKYKHFVI